MNEEQKNRAIQIWRKYCAEGVTLLNASKEYTQAELDQARTEAIPEVLTILENYLSGETTLDEFKTQNDSVNKRHRLWGFQGINGQMFFNVLTKTSRAGGQADEFDSLLKHSLVVPTSIERATTILNEFAQFTRRLANFVADSRGAPKVGSINFFVSYFWQIQSPETYPVYYSSMVNALQEYNIWQPVENIGDSYASFYRLNHELKSLFGQVSNRSLELWDVEHAFWFVTQPKPTHPPKAQAVTAVAENATPAVMQVELPDSYIPPIVAILPRLAANDPELANICQAMGSSIEKVFENRIDVIFKMLGYETEALGQGHGRVPDGVAICREFHYAIVYDAKVRQQPYTMGTDERAIREYINGILDRLRRQGIRQVYFMIISSSFNADHDDVIRGIKMDTEVREILLVEAGALVSLLEAKLRNPMLTLGPEGVQRLLANSGILGEADVKEFQGI